MRRALARAVGAAALAAGGAGCVYFNGMYNANRFARQAEQSERAGRTGEARARWQSAALHAESLTARHPNSHWVFNAQLVRGHALVHLEYWSDAVVALEDAARRAERPEQRYEALGLLGQANLAMRRYSEARQALDTAVLSQRPAVRGEALLYRGRVFLALGHPDSAQSDFRASSHPHASYDLARVELMMKDTLDAGALYDSLARVPPYVEADWRPALDSLAAAGALLHAGSLVDRLAARRDMTPGQQARLLLDDASRRLASADTAAAAARLQSVRTVAQDSVEAKIAAVGVARLDIARASSDSDLALVRGRLQELTREGGQAAQDAGDVLRMLGLVDSLGAMAVAPDAYWYLRAEVLRDSLHAGALATSSLADMASRFPGSPWTPKALVAAIAGGHPAADSLRALLAGRYGLSPYALAAGGAMAGADAFAVLEDSLRRTLARRAAPAGRAGRVEAPVRGAAEADDETIGRRGARDAPARPTPKPNQPAPAGPPKPETGPPRPQEPTP